MRTFSLFLFGISLAFLVVVASGCADGQSHRSSLAPAQSKPELPGERERCVQFQSSFEDALADAQESGKPLLVFFSVPECSYCRQMLAEAFHDPQVVQLAESFVCVRVEADDAPALCKNFHIEAFPTVQFMTPDGAPLHRVLGRKEPETLAIQMQAALDSTRVQAAHPSRVARY